MNDVLVFGKGTIFENSDAFKDGLCKYFNKLKYVLRCIIKNMIQIKQYNRFVKSILI